MTKEESAKISRENGSKIPAPKTEEGKEKSARTSIDHGLRAEKLKHFAPPHSVALCSQDRGESDQLLDEQVKGYQPLNFVAKSLVRDFAIARWQILRLDTCVTSQWNLALIDQAQKPLTVAPELGEMQTMARSVQALYTGHAIAHKLNRQIDQFGLRTTLPQPTSPNRRNPPSEPSRNPRNQLKTQATPNQNSQFSPPGTRPRSWRITRTSTPTAKSSAYRPTTWQMASTSKTTCQTYPD